MPSNVPNDSWFVYQCPAAIVYNNQIYVFFQFSGFGAPNQGTTQLFYTTSSNGSSWSNITQAGSGGAQAGSNIMAVLVSQEEAIGIPFISSRYVPDNLLGTAIIKEKPGGGWEWVTPKWLAAAA